MSRILSPFRLLSVRAPVPVLLVLAGSAAALALAAPAGANHRDRPHRPKELRVTSVEAHSVTVRWTRVRGAYAYRLYRENAAAGWRRERRVHTFPRLRCDETYRLGVRAFDRDGDRSRRRSVRVRTQSCAPKNAGLPAIRGTPAESEVVTASPGSWRGAEPMSLQYQWGRCAPDGYACSSIPGATGPSYLVGAADAGRTLRVRVRAENSYGATTVDSPAVGPVGGVSPDPEPDPGPVPGPEPDPGPDPEPDPDGGCSVADTSGCVPGTTLRLTDAKFLCDRPLAAYGPLPLEVDVDFTPGRLFGGNGAVDLYTGCAGDGDPSTIDLIVDVEGDGATYGPGADAFKVRQAAGYDGGIQVSGHVDCGPKYTESQHQDGVQVQGGRDITFVDFSVGDYEAGRSTCQGAGGAFFYSSASGYSPVNVDVVRGSYIACNHSLFRGGGTGDVHAAGFRSGRTDGTDPVCAGYAASPPCDGSGDSVTLRSVTCQGWNRTDGRWE